jgi:glycosyltransferase involved in cell wall biosynthesis
MGRGDPFDPAGRQPENAMVSVSGPRRSRGGTGIRVCHISTAHSADDSRVFWRECVGLAARGFQVTLVARAESNRFDHGVRVVALPTYRRRLVRMTLGVATAFWVGLRTKARIIHLHDPELIPLVPFFRLAGRSVIYDAHEWLSRQVAAKEYLPQVTRAGATKATRALEFAVGSLASRVVTVNEACASIYPAEKVTVVANYPEVDRFHGELDALRDATATAENQPVGAGRTAGHDGSETGGTDPQTFVYVGGISLARGIAELVAAMAELNTTDPARLDLVGRFSPAGLRDKIASHVGWEHVEYAGAVPHEEVARHLVGAVAGIATLLPTPNHLISSPVKVFEYMAAGLPVILSDFPSWRSMLDGVDCALWVDPADPRAIADAMRTLIRDPQRRAEMGATARRAVLERFNWDSQLENLIVIYRGLSAGV